MPHKFHLYLIIIVIFYYFFLRAPSPFIIYFLVVGSPKDQLPTACLCKFFLLALVQFGEIAQMVEQAAKVGIWICNGKVPGSNPAKAKNFIMLQRATERDGV